MRAIQLCSSLVTAAALLLSIGCEGHKTVDASDTPAPQYRVFDTVVVHSQPVQDQLTLAGRIQANPTTVVHIYPPISGRVLALKVLPGQEIAKDQIVGMLQSTDLQQTRADYEKAKIETARADLQLNRARDLLQHEVMSQRDYDDLAAVDQADHAELARTLQTLRILGYSETDTTGLVAIRSPIAGVVLDVNTASGELQRSLDNATPMATIANINDVWIVGDLFPRDVQSVRRGQPVDIRVSGGHHLPRCGRQHLGCSRSADPHPQGPRRPAQPEAPPQAPNVRHSRGYRYKAQRDRGARHLRHPRWRRFLRLRRAH
jgi:cobalt-zinc-cadmium efflux system membrane fusion protein